MYKLRKKFQEQKVAIKKYNIENMKEYKMFRKYGKMGNRKHDNVCFWFRRYCFEFELVHLFIGEQKYESQMIPASDPKQ